MRGVAAAAGAALPRSAPAAEPGVSDTPLPRLLNNHRVIIDTDPGIDDAMAIFYALASPELEVIGLTTVFGNAHVETCTANALHLLQIAGRPLDATLDAWLQTVLPCA